MSEEQPNDPKLEEIKRLEEKIVGFENLLRALHNNQLEQTQTLAAFVSQIRGDKMVNVPTANINSSINTNVETDTSNDVSVNKKTGFSIGTSANNTNANTNTNVAQKSSASAEYLKVQRKALIFGSQYLKSHLKTLEDRFVSTSLPDPKTASDELKQEGFNFSWVPKEGGEEEDKPDALRLPEFLSLVGRGHQPVHVHLRDFTDRSCEKVTYYEATDFEGLWKALARPVRYILASVSRSRVNARYILAGINVVRQLTPNVAIALLISSAYSGLRLEYAEPLESLLTIMTIALSPEPHSLQDFVGYMNHDTFAFNVVFFELFDEKCNKRQETVSAPQPHRGKKFGSQWEGVFAPKNINRHSKPKNIRQTTLSLIFDSMATETGTNWTVISIGEYSDEKAFKKPRNVKDVEKYTAPEEVFLDKLSRMIDWAVDEGMWKVLDQLEVELGDRADVLFFTKENEKLLFDDHNFSRTKRYHWALQWLKKMSDSINEFVTAIEEFEKISLPNLRRNAQTHRMRSRVKTGKAELSSEKIFERKVERAKKLRGKIDTKYSLYL